jgi:sugar diacid utilization regulator
VPTMGTRRAVAARKAGAQDPASGPAAELLADYLVLLERAWRSGARAAPHDLDTIRRLGGVAAENGMTAEAAVRLYLASACRFWREHPPDADGHDAASIWAAGGAVLGVVDDAVAALVEGHQARRREAAHEEGALRRRFVEDLLRGDADVAALVERAEPFGLDLARPHQIALASSAGGAPVPDAAATILERRVVDRYGDREVLVATKDDLLVVLVPELPVDPRGDVGDHVHAILEAYRRGGPWRVGVGRPHAGAYGVARSYEEAREALALMRRLHLDTPVLRARDLLVYRVVGRDHAALVDLVQAALTPLLAARGGAEPLLRTLETYFASGGNVTDTARRLHLSVRAVDYRLSRVRALTGFDVVDAHARFTLHVAVVGARLIGWPDVDARSP